MSIICHDPTVRNPLLELREAHHDHQGQAVQVDPFKTKLKPPGTKRLKLNCDILLSTSASKYNLRRYTKGAIYDVIVDLRADSPTFRRWCAVIVSSENRRQLHIPAGRGGTMITHRKFPTTCPRPTRVAVSLKAPPSRRRG